MTEKTSPLLRLLEPFPAEHIGKLPRVTCGPCSKKQCNEHSRKRCDVCSSYISEQHIHLDYVGHADVTRRLLEIDPTWQWEPKAEDENGLPVFDTDNNDNPVGFWIKLTVCGVTRLGYGSCPSNQNDAVKVLIGDALRNAAMRFGVALDLWAKGDRADPAAENATAAGGTAARRTRRSQQQTAEPRTDPAWLKSMMQRIRSAGSREELVTLANEIRARKAVNGVEVRHETELWNAGLERQQELDGNSRPTNKDGSTSRSRATDEQLAANGEMTKDQLREHNRMVRDAQSNPRKAERATGPVEDDPWVTDGQRRAS